MYVSELKIIKFDNDLVETNHGIIDLKNHRVSVVLGDNQSLTANKKGLIIRNSGRENGWFDEKSKEWIEGEEYTLALIIPWEFFWDWVTSAEWPSRPEIPVFNLHIPNFREEDQNVFSPKEDMDEKTRKSYWDEA